MKTNKRVKVFYRSVGPALEDEVNSFLEAVDINISGEYNASTGLSVHVATWGVLIEYTQRVEKKEEKTE